MLKSWLATNSGTKFWLADNNAHKLAVAEYGFGFEGELPLFTGPEFQSVQAFSPWLVPVSEGLLQVSSEVLAQGIAISSQALATDILEHLRSLLFASFEGEEVMFRYYDLKVLSPMLLQFEENERSRFMGNIDEIAYLDDELKMYSNNLKTSFELNRTTWWNILPHHIASLYQRETHAKSLNRRWWQLSSRMMERVENSELVILSALKRAQTNGFESSQWESCALVEIAGHANVHLSELSIPFHLTFDEVKLLEKIKEKWG